MLTLDIGMIAAPVLTGILGLLVKIIIAGLIAYIVFWALGKIGLPEPFNKIALAIVVLLVAYYLISLLLAMG